MTRKKKHSRTTASSARKKKTKSARTEDYRTLVENLNEGVYRSTPDGRIVLANPALARILGYDSVEELCRRDVASDIYLDPNDRRANVKVLSEQGSIVHYGLKLRKKSGEVIFVEETSRAVYDEKGDILYFEGIIEDVSDRAHAEQQAEYFQEQILQSEERYRSLVENANDAIWVLDTEGRFVLLNRIFEEITGRTRESLQGKSFLEAGIIPSEFLELVRSEFRQRLQGGPGKRYEIDVLDIGGERIPVEINSQALYVDGKIVGVQGIGRDIRQRKALEKELLATKNHLESIFDNALDAIISTDSEGMIIGWNKGAESVFHMTREEVAGQSIEKLFPPDKYFQYYRARRNLLLGNAVSDLEFTWTRPDGSQIFLNIAVSPIKDDKGVVQGASAIARDATEKKKLEVTLQHLVITDHLTETYNRYYFDQLLEKELVRSKRYGYSISILLIDIDGFKEINDRHGHLVGDKVLKDSARILKSSIRNSDTVVRYGGDEFLVLLPETDRSKIKYVVRRVQEKLEHWNETQTILEKALQFSIGYATCTEGEDFEKALRIADMLMYQNKHRKRQDGSG
ncbi:MAG TPA: PAS domain S-box protein [Acidobacteriota bacterium]|nr:PAS domain S-box protein [Acidobacteriota bacterium]